MTLQEKTTQEQIIKKNLYSHSQELNFFRVLCNKTLEKFGMKSFEVAKGNRF